MKMWLPPWFRPPKLLDFLLFQARNTHNLTNTHVVHLYEGDEGGGRLNYTLRYRRLNVAKQVAVRSRPLRLINKNSTSAIGSIFEKQCLFFHERL